MKSHALDPVLLPESLEEPRLRRLVRMLEADPLFAATAAAAVHLALLYLAKLQVFERMAPLIPPEALSVERWGFLAGVGLNAIGDVALYVTLWLWLSHACSRFFRRPCARRLFGSLALSFIPGIVWSASAIVLVRFFPPPLADASPDASIQSAAAAVRDHLQTGTLGVLVSARSWGYVLAAAVAGLVVAETAAVGRGRALLAAAAYVLAVAGILAASGILAT